MDLEEIQQIFFQECEEALLTIETAFGLCRDGAHDDETINTIFRGVHSIKGGAGAFGHDALQGFSHHYETLLDKVRNGELALNPTLLTTLLAAFDILSDHIAAAKGEQPTPADAAMLERLVAAADPAAAPSATTEVDVQTEAETPPAAPSCDAPAADADLELDDIFSMLDDAPPAPAVDEPASVWRLSYQPGPGAFDNGGEPVLLLRELQLLGGRTQAADLTALPLLDQLQPELACTAWTVLLPGDADEDAIRGTFDFIGQGCRFTLERTNDAEAIAWMTAPEAELPAPLSLPKPAAPVVVAAQEIAPATITPADTAPSRNAPQAAAAANQTIRVDLDKLDRLVNLVGELVITQAMLAQRLSVHGLGTVDELTDLDHLTRELQDSAMSIRAQPMKTVFGRVPRIIRELEGETGKRVRLEVEGEMTEVDKTVVERIGEPLTHLIRNAVDHGIEKPAERRAAGKNEEGVVRLSAEHRSGRIVISIADDGKGIDRERVRAKAVERGIIAPDAMLGNEEIDNLIFAAGFSTAETVSNISGRGVGMDVVRKNVQALGGRIGIVSNPGRGSVFSLSLPLTLAVLDGMIVRVGDETFVIPLGHVVESLRPSPGDIKRTGSGALLDVRGCYVPIQDVGRQLSVASARTTPEDGVLIVVDSDMGQAVLLVDAIQDQRQVVVKSLEANYDVVPGLAGATILGDGRVALILDVDSLVARWRQEHRTPAGTLDLAA